MAIITFDSLRAGFYDGARPTAQHFVDLIDKLEQVNATVTVPSHIFATETEILSGIDTKKVLNLVLLRYFLKEYVRIEDRQTHIDTNTGRPFPSLRLPNLERDILDKLFAVADDSTLTGPSALFNPGIGRLDCSQLRGELNPDRIPANAVITAHIADGAVTTAKLRDGAVTTPKLATGAVTAGKLADSTVITAHIANEAVRTAKLADGAVTAAKIADEAVIDRQIQADSVTTDKLADGAVIEDNIATSAVTSAKLADGAVTTDKIAFLAVTNHKIAAGAVTRDKILDGIVSEAHLGYAAVIRDKINPGAVTADKLAANAVTTDKIKDGVVSTPKLDLGAVTTAKIADEAVTTPKLADDAVTTRNISGRIVRNRNIVDGAVTTDKIADDAVIEAKLAAGAVTTDKIKDGAVTTPKIKDGAVDTDRFKRIEYIPSRNIDPSKSLKRSIDISRTIVREILFPVKNPPIQINQCILTVSFQTRSSRGYINRFFEGIGSHTERTNNREDTRYSRDFIPISMVPFTGQIMRIGLSGRVIDITDVDFLYVHKTNYIKGITRGGQPTLISINTDSSVSLYYDARMKRRADNQYYTGAQDSTSGNFYGITLSQALLNKLITVGVAPDTETFPQGHQSSLQIHSTGYSASSFGKTIDTNGFFGTRDGLIDSTQYSRIIMTLKVPIILKVIIDFKIRFTHSTLGTQGVHEMRFSDIFDRYY